MLIPPNPYETYAGPAEETKGPCDECQRVANLNEMALLAGKYICDRCLDPKQRGFDLMLSIVEHLDAANQGLTSECRRLRFELAMATKGRAA